MPLAAILRLASAVLPIGVLIAPDTAPAQAELTPSTTKLVEQTTEYNAILETIDIVARRAVAPVESRVLFDRCLEGWPSRTQTTRSGTNESLKEAFADTPMVALWAATEQCLVRVMQTSPGSGDRYISRIELNTLTRARPAGIGVETVAVEDGLLIVGTRANSPASRAGLSRGDRITAIHGETLGSSGGGDVFASFLDGPAGSEIQVQVVNGQSAETRTYVLKRERMAADLIRLAEVDNGIFLSVTPSLTYEAIKQWVHALQTAVGRNAALLQGLILDLRTSTGGDLQSVVAFASLFVGDETTIVVLRARDGETSLKLQKQSGEVARFVSGLPRELRDRLLSVPLIVITGPKTSSGAEIIAGALQHFARASVVGSRTAGVASIKTLYPLRVGAQSGQFGALSLTTALAVLADGKDLQGVGVMPNVVLEIPPEPDGFPRSRLQLPEIGPGRAISDPVVFAALTRIRKTSMTTTLRGGVQTNASAN